MLVLPRPIFRMTKGKISNMAWFCGRSKGQLWMGFLMLMMPCILLVSTKFYFMGSLKFYEISPSKGCPSAVRLRSLAQQIDSVVHLLLTRSDRECYTPKAVSVLQAVAQELDPQLDINRPLGESSPLSSSAHDHLSSSYDPAAGTVSGGRSRSGNTLGEDQTEGEEVGTLDGDKSIVDLEENMTFDQHAGKHFTNDTVIKEVSRGETTQRRNVCPEVYHNTSKSWTRPKCEGVPKFSNVVTGVLMVHSMDANQVLLLVEHVWKIHHMRIIVLTVDLAFKFPDKEEFDVTYLTDSRKLGETLNRKILDVTTPYVFLGVHLIHFTEHSNLERLIETLDNLNFVDVAGGSLRDESGLWHHGCLQMGLSNYKATYEMGYHHSRSGCMFCNHISSPFVVRTTLLQEINFSPKLSEEVLFQDWYMKLLVDGRVSVVCPDVMFFGQEVRRPSHNHWLELAEQWALQKIITEDGEQHEFECKDIGLDCNNMYDMVKKYLLPPCCLDYLTELLEKLQDCLEEQKLPYRLSYGSLLSAVKMAGPLPWDFDIDLQVECADKPHVYGPTMAACLKQMGCSRPFEITGSYWVLKCAGLNFDMGCLDNITEDLPYEFRDRPTVINYKSKRMMVATNPAKITRNYYGEGYLRHETHWRFKSPSSSWSSCPTPYFHACQERFPSDGNLAFKLHHIC